MGDSVERSSLDLRYEGHRLRDDAGEARLFSSIAARGIEEPLEGVDTPEGRLLAMCLIHDLPEARMGDLNSVQKKYVTANEKMAVAHMARGLPFGPDIHALLDEFNARETLEAQLARDADQLAFLLDLKSLSDMGYAAPDKWSAHVKARLQTAAGIELSESIAKTEWDSWWLKLFIDSDRKEK